MSELLHQPRRLEKGDDRSSFSSGAAELDQWFQKFARENQRANNAVSYVVAHEDTVLGYHAIAAAGISTYDVPPSFGKQRPHDIPCIFLARLAVDERFQGRRLGVALFRDAIERAVLASDTIGAACLLIHARDQSARAFYLTHADLLESPVDPLHLVLPMKAAKNFLNG